MGEPVVFERVSREPLPRDLAAERAVILGKLLNEHSCLLARSVETKRAADEAAEIHRAVGKALTMVRLKILDAVP